MGDIEAVHAGALGTGRSKRMTVTAGITAIPVPPAPGRWSYLKVINTHATAVVSVGIEETPAVATASIPPVVGDWKVGYDIGPGGSEMIPLVAAIVTIQVLSDTASTPVILNLIA